MSNSVAVCADWWTRFLHWRIQVRVQAGIRVSIRGSYHLLRWSEVRIQMRVQAGIRVSIRGSYHLLRWSEVRIQVQVQAGIRVSIRGSYNLLRWSEVRLFSLKMEAVMGILKMSSYHENRYLTTSQKSCVADIHKVLKNLQWICGFKWYRTILMRRLDGACSLHSNNVMFS